MKKQPGCFSFEGGVDDSIPREYVGGLAAGEGVEPDEFCDWLAVEIGRYRSSRDWRTQQPPPTAERKILRDFQKALRHVITRIAPGGLPADAEARIVAAYRRDFFTDAQTVSQTLYRIAAAAESAERAVKPAKPGARRDRERDLLLLAVAAQLDPGEANRDGALSVAAAILDACGIANLADTPRTRAKAARRAAPN